MTSTDARVQIIDEPVVVYRVDHGENAVWNLAEAPTAQRIFRTIARTCRTMLQIRYFKKTAKDFGIECVVNENPPEIS